MRPSIRGVTWALAALVLLGLPADPAAAQREGDPDEALRRSQPRQPERAERPRSERDRDQDKPRTRDAQDPRAPVSELPRLVTPPVPLPPPGLGAVPGFFADERIVLDCPETRVCLLDPLDEYVAWMLSAQTTIAWRHIVDARAEDLQWSRVLDEIGIARWELFHALGQEAPAGEIAAPTDEEVRTMATRHLARIQPPSFSCRLPVVLEGISAQQLDAQQGTRRSMLDSVDDDIAARIAEETGWCDDDLLDARRFLGDWSRTARELSISPFLFEVSFGIELEVLDLRTRVVRYPTEEQIRSVAREAAWPETVEGR